MQEQQGARLGTEELQEIIVDGLVGHHARNDIILSVCERGGLEWPEAEELVKRVEVERAHAIARGQMPLIALLSAAIVATGAWILNDALAMVRDIITGNLFTQVVLLSISYYPLSLALMGGTMVAGGMIGFWKALRKYFET